MSDTPERTGRPVRLWAWVAVVLAAVAVACVTVALRTGPVARVADVTPLPAPTTATPLDGSATPRSAPTPAAPPVRVRIPSIDVAARVTRLGLNPDRTVEVPTDPATTGWYRLGPAPGQPGSAVILGHVDSVDGPAVFYRLRYLEPGDRVVVDAADGSTATFRVLRLATYPNESFPAEQVYAARRPGRFLNLITCGGAYDEQSGYQANVVVYTRRIHV